MIPENKTPPRPCGRKSGLSHTISIVRILWIFSVILVVFLSLSPKMHVTLEFRESDKIAHFIAYLWLAVLPFIAFSPPAALRRALLMVPLGIVLEFAQTVVPGRFFSFGDMLANFLGVVLGIWISGVVRKKLKVQI